MARYPDGSLDVDSQQSGLSVGHLQERSTRGDQSMVGEVLQCQSVDTTHRSVKPRARVIECRVMWRSKQVVYTS